LEPLKIIRIGKIEDNKLVLYETIINDEIIRPLISLSYDETFISLKEHHGSLKFKTKKALFGLEGEIIEFSIFQEYDFPMLSEIEASGGLHNILEYFSHYIFPACDFLENACGAEHDSPSNGNLQRFWCYGKDLVWVNRPSRSKADYDFIKLKVEEFFLQREDEYLLLAQKVERLRNLKESRQSARRKDIPDDVLAYVLKRDEEKCVKCFSTQNLQFDHILPKSRGGGDHPENLRVLCQSCNLTRGNLTNI
jgi:hypothetical protein